MPLVAQQAGIELTVKVMQQWFLDRARVARLVRRVTRQRLAQVGAYIRTAARSSMKPARRQRLSEMPAAQRLRHQRALASAKAEGRPAPRRPRMPSRPGEPPRVIVGHLRRFLFFAYDPTSTSVVIGPAKLNRRGDVPAVLEYGGTVRSTRLRRDVQLEPRPYMGPALEQELPRFRAVWGNAFTQV